MADTDGGPGAYVTLAMVHTIGQPDAIAFDQLYESDPAGAARALTDSEAEQVAVFLGEFPQTLRMNGAADAIPDCLAAIEWLWEVRA